MIFHLIYAFRAGVFLRQENGDQRNDQCDSCGHKGDHLVIIVSEFQDQEAYEGTSQKSQAVSGLDLSHGARSRGLTEFVSDQPTSNGVINSRNPINNTRQEKPSDGLCKSQNQITHNYTQLAQNRFAFNFFGR